MTWKKALRTVLIRPLYLLMTLLPRLLLLALAFPILQKAYALTDTILTPLLSSRWMPWLAVTSPTYADVLAVFLPMLGLVSLFALAVLLDRLVLAPIAAQYLGDAVAGGGFSGFAGRGLRRLWYRPMVFSILAGLILVPLAGVMAMLSAWSLLYPGFEAVYPIVLAVVGVLFLLLCMGVYHAFLGISAVEELRLFPALGRAFGLFFRRLPGFLLPSLLSLGLLAAMFFVFFGRINLAVLFVSSPVLFMERARVVLDRFFAMSAVMTLISWLMSMYLAAYATHAAAECRAKQEEAACPAGPASAESAETEPADHGEASVEASLPGLIEEVSPEPEEDSPGESAGPEDPN